MGVITCAAVFYVHEACLPVSVYFDPDPLLNSVFEEARTALDRHDPAGAESDGQTGNVLARNHPVSIDRVLGPIEVSTPGC